MLISFTVRKENGDAVKGNKNEGVYFGGINHEA